MRHRSIIKNKYHYRRRRRWILIDLFMRPLFIKLQDMVQQRKDILEVVNIE